MNLAALTHLGLACTKVTDAGMVYFKDCKDLKFLRLDGTTVTDTGLAHFKDCKDLTFLRLDATRVSDVGLAQFKDCKDLTYLNLSWTKVSDVGLAQFKDCKDLTSLLLCGTKVDDAGLAHFKGMPLRLLWIDYTGITDLNGLQGMPLEDVRRESGKCRITAIFSAKRSARPAILVDSSRPATLGCRGATTPDRPRA